MPKHHDALCRDVLKKHHSSIHAVIQRTKESGEEQTFTICENESAESETTVESGQGTSVRIPQCPTGQQSQGAIHSHPGKALEQLRHKDALAFALETNMLPSADDVHNTIGSYDYSCVISTGKPLKKTTMFCLDAANLQPSDEQAIKHVSTQLQDHIDTNIMNPNAEARAKGLRDAKQYAKKLRTHGCTIIVKDGK